jgi:D-alanine-D-alanine ligase
MSKIRVGVLRGGPSSEYDVSLKTGKTVLNALSPEKYDPIDIFIDKDGEWHIGGYPLTPDRAVQHIDVIFNAMHGEYGEDGEVQRILENLSVPYTGSRAMASAVAMHKAHAKDAFARHGLQMAPHILFDTNTQDEDDIVEIFRTFPQPSVVKPMMSGSSVGVSMVNRFDELADAIARAAEYSPIVLIESFIDGKEATCGVIEDFRGEDLYALPVVEIIPPEDSAFFDYDAKYGGETEERVPGRFSGDETAQIQDIARRAHEAVGALHYSRTDCIVSPRGIFVLEINTLPGLTEASLFPKSLDAIGVPFAHFLDHVISLSLGPNR